VQKAINEVYRTFNINQSPFVIADFILPTGTIRSYSPRIVVTGMMRGFLLQIRVNVSQDKRSILLHSENNLIEALKVRLDNSQLAFS